MRSPTTVFTKCLKIKSKANVESQKSFLAVVWAKWDLWRLMVLLFTVWESLESAAHHLIPVHQAGEAFCRPKPQFCNETAQTGRSGTSLLWACSCRSRKLIKPPIHVVSPAPWAGPAVSGGGGKSAHSLCSQKGTNFCCQSWGRASLGQLCHRHLHHLANRSQVLFCSSGSHLWNSLDSSMLFWATDHQQLTLADHICLSPVFSPWISIIYWLQAENHNRVFFYLYPY